MKKLVSGFLFWLAVMMLVNTIRAQQPMRIDSLPDLRIRTWIVKRLDSFEQVIRVYERAADTLQKGRPAAVFFFGGGWNGRNIEQFHDQSVVGPKKQNVQLSLKFLWRDYFEQVYK